MIATAAVLMSLIYGPSETISQQEYRMPPSQSTVGYVPVISDEKMEECVKLFNEADWLAEKLETTQKLNREQGLRTQSCD